MYIKYKVIIVLKRINTQLSVFFNYVCINSVDCPCIIIFKDYVFK